MTGRGIKQGETAGATMSGTAYMEKDEKVRYFPLAQGKSEKTVPRVK